MQTLLEISEDSLTKIDRISQASHVSRDEIVERAIRSYQVSEGSSSDDERAIQAACGLWAHKGIAALAYQRQIREDRS